MTRPSLRRIFSAIALLAFGALAAVPCTSMAQGTIRIGAPLPLTGPLSPEARVARCLASLFNPHLYPGGSRDLQISQEEIGYLSGVSRQRVNQALQVLGQAGLLRVAYGGVSVLDLQGLATFGS